MWSIYRGKKMKLLCNRFLFNDNSTMSRFYIDGVYFCDILEDKYRGDDLSDGKKIYAKTAIPCGIYKVILSYSSRFKIWTPEILDVPFFTGIRIHTGNFETDTEGCLICGKKFDNYVIDSRKTFKELMKKLKDQKDIEIEIKLAKNGQ